MRRHGIPAVILALFASVVLATGALAAKVTSSKWKVPPNTTITVGGSGFGANELVDVYLDTTDLIFKLTTATGSFSTKIQVPADTVPGAHYLTVVGRKSGTAWQGTLTVTTPWLQFGFNSRHAGVNPYENILNAWTVSDLNLEWTAITGGSIFVSSVATANGYVYASGNDGKLYKLNAETGNIAWSRAPTTGSFFFGSAPALANVSTPSYKGMLVVVAANSGLYALKETDGSVFWSYTTPATLYYPPLIVNGKVYFSYGSLQTANSLYCLDLKTGGMAANYPLGIPGSVVGSVAYWQDYIYFMVRGTTDAIDRVYKCKATDGSDMIYYSLPGSRLPTSYTSGLSVANGVVYFGTTWDSGNTVHPELFALDALNLSLIWQTGVSSTGVIGGNLNTLPCVYRGIVYIASEDGAVYAFNSKTGSFLWKYVTGGKIWAPPIAANSVVYFGSEDKFAHAVDYSGGSLLWSARHGGNVSRSMAVVDGKLFVPDHSGKVSCYSLSPGTMARRFALPQRPDPKKLVPNNSLTLESSVEEVEQD